MSHKNKHNKKIRAIIVDDSRLARIELKHLLADFERITIINESGKPKDAIEIIESEKPDLVFLDIQMPIMNGFELLQNLNYIPEIIFVTAFDEYAIKAFEFNAIDYLQKPIEPKDLQRAVNKILQKNELAKAKTEYLPLNKVFVKDGEKCWFVNIQDIRYFEVDGNYCTIHFDDNHPMIPKTLNYIEKRIDNRLFFRANRNQMININHIKDVENWIQGIKITLTDNKTIELSRRQSQKFKELMSF